MLYALAALAGLLALAFCLQAAQLRLSEAISPVMASLVVAACLVLVAGATLFAVWIRNGRNRSSQEIGLEMGRNALATVPLVDAIVRKTSPQLLIALAVLAGAALLGRTLSKRE